MKKLFLLFCLTPYVSPIPLPMDTAPYASIMIFFLTVLAFVRPPAGGVSGGHLLIPRENVITIYILFLFSVLMFFRYLYYLDFLNFGVFANYLTFFLFILYFSLLTYSNLCVIDKFLSSVSRLIYLVAYIYFFATLLQLSTRVTGDPLFATIVDSAVSADIMGARSSIDRGFNSLAAEPSYAGIQVSVMACLSILLYSYGCLDKKRMQISVALLIISGLLTASFTAMPFIVIASTAYFLTMNLSKKFIVFFLGCIAIYIFVNTGSAAGFSGIRFARLIALFQENGILGTLSIDVSFASRFASPVNYSLPLFVEGNLLGDPFGPVDIQRLSRAIDLAPFTSHVKDSLYVGLVAEGGLLKTKSGIAQSIFLFGLLGIAFWVSLFVSVIRRRKLRHASGQDKLRRRIAILLGSVVLLGYFVQVPLGHPTLLLSLGILIITRRRTVTMIGGAGKLSPEPTTRRHLRSNHAEGCTGQRMK